MDPLITSATNPVIKRVRALARRRQREREGAAVVHGVQPVRQAAEAGVPLEHLVVAPSLLRSESARQFVADQRQRGVRVSEVTGELFGRLVDREPPSGLAAIVRPTLCPAAELAPATGPATVVALDRIGNPGNLGTIVRTANAAGAAGVLLIGATTDPFDPAAIKASMGAIFGARVARLPDLAAFRGWTGRHRLAVATTSAQAAGGLWHVRWPERVALLLGSEGDGLAPEVVADGDLQVAIPMVGTAESLNLAVAAGVLLYEVWRSRSAGPEPSNGAETTLEPSAEGEGEGPAANWVR